MKNLRNLMVVVALLAGLLVSISALSVPGTASADPPANTTTDNCPSGTDSSGNCTNSKDDTVDCGDGSFNWAICPAIQLGVKAANAVDGFIMNTLDIDVKPIFDTSTATGKGYYTAWNSFRIIATGLVVIGGLVMVVSTALGFEMLDAYTIRKTLPRLFVVVIGMSLSWPLMKLIVDFFDVVGFDIRSLIYAPFSHLPGNINVAAGILSYGAIGLLFTPAGWTFILTALLAVFVGFLILVVRQVAIIMLIVLAPVAIACYILPNTQRIWKLWSDNFLGLLLMFPIISALIAAGHVFAAVSISSHSGDGPSDIVYQALALAAYFIPYFLLPLAARLATGVIGNLAGVINDRHRGGFDRLKGMRKNAREQVHARRMAQDTWLGKGRTGSLYRRGTALGTSGSGALGMSKRGRARYAAYEQAHGQQQAAEALKNDNNRAGGDDWATSLAVQNGMTRKKFIEQYQDLAKTDEKGAELALAQTERGFGATIGSDAMQLAAFKARTSSSTAYEGEESGTQQRINEGAALINKGLLTEADAVAAGKGNRGRLDISGESFSAQMGAFRSAATSMKEGGAGMSQAEASAYLDHTLQSADPNDMLAGNTRTIKALAPAMMRNADAQLKAATAADGSIDYNHSGLNRALGQIAGVQDNLNRTSPEKAALFADMVNASHLKAGENNTFITVRQAVEQAASRPADAHGNQTFLEVRKEYGASRRNMTPAEQAAAAAQPPQPEEH